MRPRYYSICSSPLLHTDCIHIALSLEYFTCQMDSPSPVGGNTPSHDPTSTSSVKPPQPPIYYRKGLCTNYVYELCRSEFGLDRSLLTLPAHPSTRFKFPSATSNTTLLPEEGLYEEVYGSNESSVIQAVSEVSVSTTGAASTSMTNTAAVSTATAVTTEKVVHVNTPSNTTSFSSAGAGGRPHLRIFLKPSLTFRLPGSVGPPLILIGMYNTVCSVWYIQNLFMLYVYSVLIYILLYIPFIGKYI